MRFNKIFLQVLHDLRNDLGAVKADHAHRGLLKSGATLKVGVKSSEHRLVEGVDACFAYIEAKSDVGDWRRKRLIELLREVFAAYEKRVFAVYEKHSIRIASGGQAANNAAEKLFRDMVRRCEDKIDRFSEGIGQAKREHWVNRHPFASALISGTLLAIIGVVVAYLLGIVGVGS